MSATKLTLFHNDCDWVVAESPEDATRVWMEAMGKGSIIEDDVWEPWGDEKPLTINFDNDEKLTLTGAQWAAKGRMYVGSTEW